MTDEEFKPSEFIDKLAEELTEKRLAEMQTSAPHVRMPHELVSSVGSIQTDKAILAYLDAEHERRAAWEAKVEERMTKIEALNPESRDVIGTTASGATVYGLPLGCPPCKDGTRVHDMRGQSSCPDCGFVPKLAAPKETA